MENQNTADVELGHEAQTEAAAPVRVVPAAPQAEGAAAHVSSPEGDAATAAPVEAPPLPPGPLGGGPVKYRVRSGPGYLAEDPNRSTAWPGFHTLEVDAHECLNRTYPPKMVNSLGRSPEHDTEHDPWVAVEVADIATADRLARALLECGVKASIELVAGDAELPG